MDNQMEIPDNVSKKDETQTDSAITPTPAEPWLLRRRQVLARAYEIIEQLDVLDRELALHELPSATLPVEVESTDDRKEMKSKGIEGEI